MVSSQVNEPPSDAPCRMQATSQKLLRNKHVEERETATPISFAGTERRRSMAVRVLCQWKLGCEYHLEVIARCRRRTLMTRVEILRMSVALSDTFSFRITANQPFQKNTSAFVKHILPNAERHRHTVANVDFFFSRALSAYQLLNSPLTGSSSLTAPP